MLKKILIPILLLFLSSCGYEAIYSQKNNAYHNFSISEIVFDGENNINIRIKSKLNNYTLVEKDKQFILKIKSSNKSEYLNYLILYLIFALIYLNTFSPSKTYWFTQMSDKDLFLFHISIYLLILLIYFK